MAGSTSKDCNPDMQICIAGLLRSLRAGVCFAWTPRRDSTRRATRQRLDKLRNHGFGWTMPHARRTPHCAHAFGGRAPRGEAPPRGGPQRRAALSSPTPPPPHTHYTHTHITHTEDTEGAVYTRGGGLREDGPEGSGPEGRMDPGGGDPEASGPKGRSRTADSAPCMAMAPAPGPKIIKSRMVEATQSRAESRWAKPCRAAALAQNPLRSKSNCVDRRAGCEARAPRAEARGAQVASGLKA